MLALSVLADGEPCPVSKRSPNLPTYHGQQILRDFNYLSFITVLFI